MTAHVYGTRTGDFEVGDRVALAPWLDLWMRGVRFGNVTGVGRKYVRVRFDGDTAEQRLCHPTNLRMLR